SPGPKIPPLRPPVGRGGSEQLEGVREGAHGRHPAGLPRAEVAQDESKDGLDVGVAGDDADARSRGERRGRVVLEVKAEDDVARRTGE
ncbi:hypothetical protein THAOC_01890, partial [Thalassiosira oceanica]